MELTNKEKEILICLIENEIESDCDVLREDIENEERECWKEEILDLKNLLIKLKPIELVIQN